VSAKRRTAVSLAVAFAVVAVVAWRWSYDAPRGEERTDEFAGRAAAGDRGPTPREVEIEAPTERRAASEPMPERPPPVPEPSSADETAELLRAIDECVAGAVPADFERVEECLGRLELERLSPDALAQWVCASPESFFAISRVMNTRVKRLAPRSAPSFLQQFQSRCTKYRETGILTGAIAQARAASEVWYSEFLAEFAALDLTPDDGNEALIQLAEVLIEFGDAGVRAKLEDVGRGLHGGDARQLHRAALICVVTARDPARKFAYLESVVTSPSSSGDDLGNLLGAFLSSSDCWPGGDARPALSLLLLVLQDPRFSSGAAAQLKNLNPSHVPAEAASLWAQIQTLVAAQ
jgi:hypothetical protein